MTICTKFSLQDKVWMIFQNKAAVFLVTAIRVNAYSPVKPNNVTYDIKLDNNSGISMTNVIESGLFESKELLLESL